MTNYPSDDHNDRHDELHPGGEGEFPAERRDSGDKNIEPEAQVSDTPSQDQKETTPDAKHGEEHSCAPHQELPTEEEPRAEGELSAEENSSSTEEPETERPEAEAAENTADAAGKQNDSDEDGEDEDENDDEDDDDDDD
ncbi:MAG: hypothetical protein IJH68_00225, partial [Thermoguttaceae bacterium]|nr:hypothetical protein [Thermoguttaceae bacterium]